MFTSTGNPDPASSGALFKGAGGGTSGLYVSKAFEGALANHISTDIPLTFTFHMVGHTSLLSSQSSYYVYACILRAGVHIK